MNEEDDGGGYTYYNEIQLFGFTVYSHKIRRKTKIVTDSIQRTGDEADLDKFKTENSIDVKVDDSVKEKKGKIDESWKEPEIKP